MAVEVNNKNKCIVTILPYFDFLFFKYTYVSGYELNMHGVKNVGQAEIHTAEPLVPDPSASEVELAIEKLISHKLQVLIKYQQNWLK